MKKILACLLLGALSQTVWALDAADQQRLGSIQQSWAHIQYETPEKQRAAAFEQLASQAATFTTERPAVAEAWIWKASSPAAGPVPKAVSAHWARPSRPRPIWKNP